MFYSKMLISLVFDESVTDGPTEGPTDGPTDRRTDRRTDGPTDGPTVQWTNRPGYRDASTHLKTTKRHDEGRTFDIIYFDFSKACDKVCHNRLLIKLEAIGIKGELKDFL